jgi:hypothetical protein
VKDLHHSHRARTVLPVKGSTEGSRQSRLRSLQCMQPSFSHSCLLATATTHAGSVSIPAALLPPDAPQATAMRKPLTGPSTPMVVCHSASQYPLSLSALLPASRASQPPHVLYHSHSMGNHLVLACRCVALRFQLSDVYGPTPAQSQHEPGTKSDISVTSYLCFCPVHGAHCVGLTTMLVLVPIRRV